MKAKKSIAIIFIFLINILMVFIFLIPLYRDVRSHQAEGVKLQSEHDRRSDYYSEISTALFEINKRQDAMDKIDSALPIQFFFSPVIHFFQEKGVETGITIESVEFSRTRIVSAVSEKPIKGVTIEVKALGEYDNFKRFLASLEKSSRMFQVNRVSFAVSPVVSTPSQSRIQSRRFSLELEAYSY